MSDESMTGITAERLFQQIQESAAKTIQARLETELRPQVEKIYAEECAKLAVTLTGAMSFQRMGMDLHVIIQKAFEEYK